MKMRTIVLLALVAGCSRTAEDFEGAPTQRELEQLRIDACSALCDTTDRCDPGRFADLEPSDCYERCSTLMPRLHAVNQCGSREIQWMSCVGDLTCDEFDQWDSAVDSLLYHLDYTCLAEYAHALECSPSEPFDLDEDNTQYP
jgi:hypothetical protein